MFTGEKIRQGDTMKQELNDRKWVKDFYDSAAEWWGESWYEGENLQPRLSLVERLIGKAPRRLLELGAGTGETAGFLAAAGYSITAVDLSARNFKLLTEVSKKYPGVIPIQGDFLTAAIPGKFDAVCLFETFGMGSDADQRHLLQRIAGEWLLPDGVVLMDVYHPFGPVKCAGNEHLLDRLEGVPGSVDMTERSTFDPVLCRWIDEWEPVQNKKAMRRQSVRCYTPADLLLLLETTPFKVVHTEFNGVPFDPQPSVINHESPILDYEKNYAYTVLLKRK
jgi:SAM-dependent methyltransferase